ncbi:hypothetical protein HA402_005194 [Bradysia odoriphaga]|nr:hypothetical protein HA402_005194 [Bradysia odoriphaga]
MGAAIGFGMMCFANFGTRRPLLSGIQKHILAAGVFALGSRIIDGWRRDYYAERDASYRHYISLHPEDFPMPERKKFAEVLEEWVPIR